MRGGDTCTDCASPACEVEVYIIKGLHGGDPLCDECHAMRDAEEIEEALEQWNRSRPGGLGDYPPELEHI